MKTSVVLREYGVISEGKNGSPFANGVEIDSDAFENLVKYIDENSDSPSFRNAFRIFRQNRRNHIKVSNYVGYSTRIRQIHNKNFHEAADFF